LERKNTMLRLEGLSCGYGAMRALHELDLHVAEGEISALLGPNGAGKSSTIMCIAGHVAVHAGRIAYRGEDITALSPMERIKKGIAIVPEGRRLFPRLSVQENLIIGGYSRPRDRTQSGTEKVLAMFPRLAERLDQRAGSLSGGEQQMLAIGRALMSEPELLLVDELSLGLMPKMIDICYDVIAELRRGGLTIVLVEQSTQLALHVADQVCVLESGRAVWRGSAVEARNSAGLIDALLGLGRETGNDAPPS
jgi:branched-chain amino acid transport system ATP-binding protein